MTRIILFKGPAFCAGLALAAFLPVILFLFAGQAHAGQAQWDPRLVRGSLENGLSYILYDSRKEQDPFNIRLIVHAGSVDEEGPSGVAHILEHMVFQSTKAHPETLHRYIQGIGWRTGLQVNAVTREAETQFMIRTRPRDALDLDGSLALMADIAFGAQLLAQDWEKERSVILEELRQGEGAADRINRQKKDLLRTGSRYADRPTIGTRDGIGQTTTADIRAFHDRFYVASNMTLIISGRFDADKAESAIRRHFATAPHHPRPARPYVVLPLKDGLTTGKVQDKQGSSSQVTYAFRMAMPERTGEAGQFAYLQKYLLTRLMREAMERQAPHYAATIGNLGMVLQETTEERLILAFNARSNAHDAATPLLLEAVERLRREGLSRPRYEAILADMRRINENNRQAAAGRTYAEWEDRIASAILMNSVVDAPEARTERTRALLDRISFDGLNARMRQMLAAPDQVLFYQVPGNRVQAAPAAAMVEAERDRLAKLDVLPALPPLPETAAAAPQAPPLWPESARLPENGQVVSHRLDDEAGLQEWTLSNGDRLVWLSRDNRDGKLYMSGQSNRGYMNAEFGGIVSQAAMQLWTQSGFHFWTQQEYDRWSKAQAADWSWTLQDGSLNVAAAIAPEKLPALIHRYAATAIFGTLREEAAQAFRDGGRTGLSQGSTYASLLYGTSDKALPPLPTSGPATEHLRDAAKALLTETMTWFVVGPPPELAMVEAFARGVGSVPRAPSLTPAPALQRSGFHKASAETLEDDRALVRISFFTPLEWSPETAFLLSSLTPLAQQALKNELRHELGGVYSLRFELNLDPDTNRAVGALSFHCAPDRAEELIAAARAVLKRMPEVAAGADMERMKADIGFAETARLEDPNTWLRRLSLSYRRYGDARYLARMGHLGDNLTPAQLRQQAGRVFLTNDMAILTELPKKKEKTP